MAAVRLDVVEGEHVAITAKAGKPVRVTPLMFHALLDLRAGLKTVASRRGTVTYGEAAALCSNAYLPRGMGRVLDVLGEDCRRRGEPSLAALVVGEDGEVGDGYAGPAAQQREDCWAFTWPVD